MIGAKSLFLLLTSRMSNEHFMAWGWRVPFLGSAVLVLIGLWMRIRLSETPTFTRDLAQRVPVPIATVLTTHPRALAAGLLTSIVAFVLFYLLTVFTLTWGTGVLSFSRDQFLQLQVYATLACALTIVLSARLSVRYGTRPIMLVSTWLIVGFGFVFDAMLFRAELVFAFLLIGMALMGLLFGSLGTTLAQMFPTEVRYTGASLAFNLAAAVGASLTPYLALSLAHLHGLTSVGLYLSAIALVSSMGLYLAPPKPY